MEGRTLDKPNGTLTRLIGVGWCETIPAREVRPGMHWYFNYGARYEVLTADPVPGGRRITFRLQAEDGKVWPVTKQAASRVVARFPRGAVEG